MTSSRSNWLAAKIASEGYCCMYGYLTLCKARGETVIAMAKNIDISPDALWYHYRKLEKKDPQPSCQSRAECLTHIVNEILDEKKGP